MTAATLPADPAESVRLFSRERFGACIGVVALVSLLAFEAIAVATAMPAIAEALAGLRFYALAFGGMLATSVLGMVISGSWCDRRGPVGATAAGLVVFFGGLLLAGFAPSMGWLVGGRVVQGLGAGMLGVALYVGMGRVVPPSLHPRLFALLAAAWVLPGLLGPVVAAWLVGQWGWRAVFLAVAVAVPLAAMLLMPAFVRLPRSTASELPTARRRIAWAALGAAGALALNLASRAEGPASRLAMLAGGLAAAGLAAHHLLPRGSLSVRPGLPAVMALRGLLAASFATAEVFIPLYLNREAGWSLAQAGIALSSGAVLWSLGSAVQSRIVDTHDRRRGLQLGFIAVAVGIGAVLGQIVSGAPAWTVVAGWAVAGFGIGLAFPMLSVLTLALSTPTDQGRHASALQLSDALCCSASLAVAGALFGLVPDAQGHALVLALSATMAAAGACLARRAFV